jgi:hypothetical protein
MTTLPAGWPTNRTYLNPVNAYTSSIASAANGAGIVFFAVVANPKGGVDTQYCEITRYNPVTDIVTEIKKFYARDSRAYAMAAGATDPDENGKYGNVTIAVSGTTLVIGLEIRTEGVNTPIALKLPGKAV